MDLVTEIKNGEKISERLNEMGASKSELIKARDIVVDDRVRFQCNHGGCKNYGKLMCPPNVPSISDIRKLLNSYYFGIILQISTAFDKSDKKASADECAVKLHNLVIEGERYAFKLNFPYVLGMIGGPCKLCEKCTVPCPKPESARPSMEAMGIDVLSTTAKVNLSVSFSSEQITWTGLILLN